MRSLSTKLLLAFALTSLAGIALAALFVRQFVTTEFDAYVLNQRRDEFVAQMTQYYQQHGSWDGVESALRELLHSTPDTQPDVRVDFVLANAAGTIILAPDRGLRGQQADAGALAGGTPVVVDGATVGIVMVFEPPTRDPAEVRYLARTDSALAIAAMGALGVALMLGLLLARVITRPLRDLTDAVRAIGAGNLRQQVPVRSRDELGALAAQFNAMSAELHRAVELRRRMTADIAHDLRTPLTVVAGYLEALRDEALRPTPARFAAMYDETQVLLRLVEDLHTLSLVDAGELVLKRQSIAPQRLLERVTQTFHDMATQKGILLEMEMGDALPDFSVDVEQIARVLNNLVANAVRHTPSGGRIRLSARNADGDIVLEVADTGEGIPAEHLPNIFERFYRPDQSRTSSSGGSGLGLAIVRSIVEAHGGQVSVASTHGQGTTFAVRLPVAAPVVLHAA